MHKTLLTEADYKSIAVCVLISKHDEFLDGLSIYTDGLGGERAVTEHFFKRHVWNAIKDADQKKLGHLKLLLLGTIVKTRVSMVGTDYLDCRLLISKVSILPASNLPEFFTKVAVALQYLCTYCIDWAEEERVRSDAEEPFPF